MTSHSTFMHTIEVDSIHATKLSGTTFNYTKTGNPIKSSAETNIAQIDFIPPKLCEYDCHIEYPDRWTPSAILESFQSGKSGLLSQKLRLFRRFKAELSSILFHVHTNFIKRYDFNGSLALTWPRLVKSQVDFPVIQTGHEAVHYVDVHNPSSETLAVYYTLHEFTNSLTTHLPPEVVSDCWNCFLTRDQVFSFVDEDIQKLRVQYIPPMTTGSVAVKFAPDLPGNFTTMLYIRNNLTVIEAVWLVAKAALPQFKFGNRKPGSRTPLLFELSEKTLFDCTQASSQAAGYSIKRTFTAKNSGETPIQINGFRIDNFSCEGYGYRIIDCSPFELAPNTSRKIGISFSPDFTLAMVKKMLYIDTSLGYSINYTLLSMISPLCLETCSKSLPRPYWESILKTVTACIAAITFLCVLLAAYLDAMKNLQSHLKNLTKAKGLLQPALDLRQIGSKLSTNENKDKEPSSTHTTTAKTVVASTNSNNPNKMNGNARKQKQMPSKKRVDNVIVENGSCKQKPWPTEFAERVTEKILGNSSEKVEEPKPKTLSPNEKNNKKPKERSRLKLNPTKIEHDEDVLSTSTENSNQSDEKYTFIEETKVTKSPINVNLDQKDKNMKKPKKTSPQSRERYPEPAVLPEVLVVLKQSLPVPEEPMPPPVPRKIITPKPTIIDPVPISKKLPKKKPTFSAEQNTSIFFEANHLNLISKREKLPKEYTTKPLQGNGYHYPFAMSQQQPPPVTTSQSPTNASRISFSRIVQNPSPNSLTNSPPSLPRFSPAPMKREFLPSNVNENRSPAMNNFLNEHVPFLNDSYERLDKPRSSVDLGPIGTRKIPAAAPTWRPLHPMGATSSSLENVLNGNNGNNGHHHFNANENHANNLNYRNRYSEMPPNPDYFMGPSSGLRHNDTNQAMAEQEQRIWDSALLLDILKQQHNAQEHAEGMRRHSNFTAAPRREPTNLTEFQRFYLHGNMWNADQSYGEQSYGDQTYNDQSYADQSYARNHNSHRQQQPDERWSAPQSSHQMRPPPGLGHIVIKNNSQINGDQTQYTGTDPAEMPQYNPFNTLSSIWSSDSWPTNLLKRNSDQQQ